MKHTYSIWDNLKFVSGNLWKKDRPFFFWGVLKGVTFVSVPLLGIFLQKTALDGILNHWGFSRFMQSILILTGLAVLAGVLNNCASIEMAHYQGMNRMRFMVEMERIFMKCPYQMAESSKIQLALDKVSDLIGTAAYRTGLNGIHNGMYEGFASLLGLIVFGSMTGRLHIWLLLLVVAGAVGTSFVEHRADSVDFCLRMEQVPFQKKQDYFRNRLATSQAGKDIRTYGCQKWLMNKLYKVIQQKEVLQKKQTGQLFQKDAALLGIEIIQNGAAVCWLTLSCLKGNLAISEFFVYLTAVLQLSEYIGKFIKALDLIKYANLDMKEIREFLDLEQEEGKDFGVKQKKNGVKAFEIRMEHVYFRYPDSDLWILEDVNLTIRPGEKIALVGNNGAGKTTLVKLLCGFYPVTKGQILFDGEDISQMEKSVLYQKISAVFQDIVVLPFSVAQNVSLCKDGKIDEKKVRQCLERAGISEKLPDIQAMLDKRVYKGGIELSGGEKQKLVFARALYKDAGFLILDEPTAALDPVAESRLYQQYHEIANNKTTLFISHRLASTSFCDRIILLDSGKIMEDGTHLSLLKKNGKYAEMFRLQSQYYQKEGAENE